jgi:phospholipid-binding lipoprotein MlaA
MSILRCLPLLIAMLLTGCASTHPKDPLEPLNRGIYQFNDTLDKAILKPVAQGYAKVVPAPAQTVVHNFFSNLEDIAVTFNDLLQLKFAQAASDGSRVLINSTFGVLGLFNVADKLEKHHEDFGQTLGYWGVGNGAYLMLPLLGPSTVRDGLGSLVDVHPLNQIKPANARNQSMVLSAVKGRAGLLQQEQVMDDAIIDRYAFIRDAYLQHRESQVYDGSPPRKKYDADNDEAELTAPNPTVAASSPSNAPASPDPEPAVIMPSLAAMNTPASSLTVQKLWLTPAR